MRIKSYICLVGVGFFSFLASPLLADQASGVPAIKSLSLVDADSDTVLFELEPGQTLNLSSLPSRKLNIVAETDPAQVSKVVFSLDRTKTYRIESGAPYALAGNIGPNYNPWTPKLGTRDIVAIAHLRGKQSPPFHLQLEVVD